MHIIDVFWCLCWSRYWGHSNVCVCGGGEGGRGGGLYSKVFGGWRGLGAYLCVFLGFLGRDGCI
jgi:hypothetical protein